MKLSSFYKFFKSSKPLKFATSAFMTSMLGYYSYQKTFLANENNKTPSHEPENNHNGLELHKMHMDNLLLFSGNANRPLAEEVAKELNMILSKANVGRFADGEVQINVLENVRGKDVYIIQPTCPPVNENLVELLLLISTMRRASARKINVVIPYYGYARQDRKANPRVPISAADVARLLETMGCDRVVAVDLHCGQIQGFFGPSIPVDNIEGNISAVKHFKKYVQNSQKLTVVSPDAGGVTRAKKFRELLANELEKDVSLAMIIKHRSGPGKIAEMHFIGSVEGSDIVIVDDIIDSAHTLCEAAKITKEVGKANKIFAFGSHGLFSGDALDCIKGSVLEKIVTTNTIPAKPEEKNIPKIERISVAPLLAETIRRIQGKQSVSSLFDPDTYKHHQQTGMSYIKSKDIYRE